MKNVQGNCLIICKKSSIETNTYSSEVPEQNRQLTWKLNIWSLWKNYRKSDRLLCGNFYEETASLENKKLSTVLK